MAGGRPRMLTEDDIKKRKEFLQRCFEYREFDLLCCMHVRFATTLSLRTHRASCYVPPPSPWLPFRRPRQTSQARRCAKGYVGAGGAVQRRRRERQSRGAVECMGAILSSDPRSVRQIDQVNLPPLTTIPLFCIERLSFAGTPTFWIMMCRCSSRVLVCLSQWDLTAGGTW